MPRRRNSPLLNGGSHSALPDGSTGTGSAQGSTGGGRVGRPIKFTFALLLLSALYYHITMKEKSSILLKTQKPVVTETAEVVKDVKDVEVAKEDLLELRSKPHKRKFILQPDSEYTPAIAWLMSFPNSGTSFTMTMVARASNRSFATNYGDEVTAKDELDSQSIYPLRPEGPYWPAYSGKIASPRELPDKYVLTKTHCGSRCVDCGPDEYVETPRVFLKRCASGHARVAPKRRRIDVEYPPERVAKAVHLIRNPLHNIIARFHLEHRHQRYSNHTEWLEHHSNDAEGLQKWCRDLDREYKKQDEAYFGQDKIPEAPCHGEFYKFTQWHNYVHEGLALIEHEVPILTVYYEDYTNRFNQTAHRILDFLELEQVGELREFSARSDYGGYFSSRQVEQIKELIKQVAISKTWDQLKGYFGE